MQITLIGTGFVGVVSATVYASFGHQVTGLDIDPKRIASLSAGTPPFFEPGLEELLHAQQKKGNLTFTTDYQQAIQSAEVIIIAVGTPSAPDGQADLKYVFAAAESLAPYLQKDAIVVIKSTVPPGTLEKVEAVIKKVTQTAFFTASVPEFLREGSAVNDTLNPDRVIIGATHPEVFTRLEALHAPLNAPVIKIAPASAQMAKYSANAYLATRITFINQIADLCQKNGANIQEIIEAIGYDQRIGRHYWYPGFGYGGSCFPKDVKEIAAYSRAVGEGNNLFNKVSELNEDRIPRLLDFYEQAIGGWSGKKVAILGLSFKPNTDDMREAPALKVVPILIEKGAQVTGFDPKAHWSEYSRGIPHADKFIQVDSLEQAAADADVIIALVEWPEIISADLSKVRAPQKTQWLLDARNQFNPAQVMEWGYKYLGVGR